MKPKTHTQNKSKNKRQQSQRFSLFQLPQSNVQTENVWVTQTLVCHYHVYTPSRTLCSSSDTRMLEIQQYKRKTHGFRTFSCFGPHIWNSLSQDLRHCSTLSSFKAKLKIFLVSQYFRPN